MNLIFMNSKTLAKKYFNFGVADRQMFQLSTEQSFPQNENGSSCLLIIYFYCSFLGPNHAASKEFENGVFTLKTHQIFSVHTTLAKFKTQQHQLFWICVWEKLDQENHKIIMTTSFSSRRHPFSICCFRSIRKRKANVFK